MGAQPLYNSSGYTLDIPAFPLRPPQTKIHVHEENTGKYVCDKG